MGDQVLLKNWNTNHVKNLGYSQEKLLNMNGSEFFTEHEFKRVVKAIEQVFKKGTVQIKTKIIVIINKITAIIISQFLNILSFSFI